MTSSTTDSSSEFRQLVFVDAETRTKNDFILPILNLRSSHRYRLTILAIDRQSRASSKKPFTFDVKTEKNFSNQRQQQQQRPTVVRISTLPPPTTFVATSETASINKSKLQPHNNFLENFIIQKIDLGPFKNDEFIPKWRHVFREMGKEIYDDII